VVLELEDDFPLAAPIELDDIQRPEVSWYLGVSNGRRIVFGSDRDSLRTLFLQLKIR